MRRPATPPWDRCKGGTLHEFESERVGPARRRASGAPGGGGRRTRCARSLAAGVRRAIVRTRQWLLDQQHPDGFWCAELEGDTILESETILLWAYLGLERHTPCPQGRRLSRPKSSFPTAAGRCIPAGGVEISGSVKAYFALKLTGHDASAEYMQRARRAILAHGGADAVNSFTRFYLALLGQISYNQCPGGPAGDGLVPEVVPREPLRRQLLVADDHRAAVDRLGVAAGAADRGDPRHPRVVPAGAGRTGRRFAVRG